MVLLHRFMVWLYVAAVKQKAILPREQAAYFGEWCEM
jgi:hypothetical protein